MTSYSVASRAREIAVRIALGARTDQVVAMLLRHALAVAMIGSVLGGLAAIVAGFLIQAEVFGVAGFDVATLSGSAALLAVAMLLARILPDRRRPAGPVCGAARRVGSMTDRHSALTDIVRSSRAA